MNKSTLFLVGLVFSGLLTLDGFAQGSGIVPGQIKSGQISSVAQTNFYTFTASSNDVISFGLLRTNGSGSPSLALYGPTANLLFESAGDGTVIFDESHQLLQTGTYTLAVRSTSGVFDYLLSLTEVACGVNLREAGDGRGDADARGLQRGADHLHGYGHLLLHRCKQRSGEPLPDDHQRVCIQSLRPSVRSGQGVFVPLPLQSGAQWAFAERWRLSKSGTYTLVVRDDTLSESFGYQLGYFVNGCGANPHDPGDGPETLTPGAFSGGQITFMDMDTYCFTGASNDLVNLSLMITNGSAFNPYVQVSRPDKVFCSHCRFSAGAQWAFAERWRLSKSGTYTLVVRDDTA